jgi:predicted N-formylglutamate amidohydrolase
MDAPTPNLLAADEPSPVIVSHEDAVSPFVLSADHAGRRIPRKLGALGLTARDLDRHIAFDIGIAGTSERLASALGAFHIAQVYSRLVIDCNRPTSVASSIPEVSELTGIPGNRGLSQPDRLARQAEIFWPYHRRFADALGRRQAANMPTVLVAMHSFTPVFKSVARPWHVGLLYNRGTDFAHVLLALLRAEGDLLVGDKQPYTVSEETDYALPVYGEQGGLPHVGIEIRQDLIAEEAGQRAWAERLARLLPEAWRQLALSGR